MKSSTVIACLLLLFGALLGGCSTSGKLGVVTKNLEQPAALLNGGASYEEIGPAEGKACRHFVLALIPWGASDLRTALDLALTQSGGDALVDVTVESELYGFFPIYNVYSLSCTRVTGTAVNLRT